MILKTIFWLPLTLLQLVLPFNPKMYRPSTEAERARGQYLRNKGRVAAYYAKRVINPRDM